MKTNRNELINAKEKHLKQFGATCAKIQNLKDELKKSFQYLVGRYYKYRGHYIYVIEVSDVEEYTIELNVLQCNGNSTRPSVMTTEHYLHLDQPEELIEVSRDDFEHRMNTLILKQRQILNQ
ncbi:MAG: hypothetical protein ACRCSR_04915 [Bacteroidales bacterium]